MTSLAIINTSTVIVMGGGGAFVFGVLRDRLGIAFAGWIVALAAAGSLSAMALNHVI